MAVYEFLLEGAVSGTVIDQYPFEGVSWSRELNGPGGFTGTLPLARLVSRPPTYSVALVVGDAAAPTGGDQLLQTWLNDDFHVTNVDLFDDAAPETDIDPGAYRLVVITESVNDATVGTKWKDFAGAVLVIDAPTLFSHQLSTNASPGAPQENQFVIESPPAWLLLTPNTYDHTADGANTFTRVVRASNSPTAVQLNARREGSDLDYHLFTLEAGQERLDASTAPGRRAFITGVEAHLNDPPSAAYETLFKNLAVWLLNATPTSVTRGMITRENLNGRWSTILWVLRDGTIVWGGVVVGLDTDLADNTLQVAAQGFWAYYHKLHVHGSFGGTPVEQFDYVEDLIALAHSLPGSDLGTVVERSPTNTGQTREDNVLRGERPVIGELIEAFADRRGGFDFELVASGTRQNRIKTLHLAYPRRGRRTTWVWATDKNIIDANYAEDGLSAALHVVAQGAGEPPFTLERGAMDNQALAGSMRTEAVVSYPQISRGATLVGRAASNLQKLRFGSRTLSVTLEPDVDAQVGSFIPGDDVRIVIDQPGWLQLDEIWRIVRYTVHPDNSGSETIDVELAPLDAFILV